MRIPCAQRPGARSASDDDQTARERTSPRTQRDVRTAHSAARPGSCPNACSSWDFRRGGVPASVARRLVRRSVAPRRERWRRSDRAVFGGTAIAIAVGLLVWNLGFREGATGRTSGKGWVGLVTRDAKTKQPIGVRRALRRPFDRTGIEVVRESTRAKKGSRNSRATTASGQLVDAG